MSGRGCANTQHASESIWNRAEFGALAGRYASAQAASRFAASGNKPQRFFRPSARFQETPGRDG
jgi:hypothetical protein